MTPLTAILWPLPNGKIQSCHCKIFGHKEAHCFKKKEKQQEQHHANLIEVRELVAKEEFKEVYACIVILRMSSLR